VIFGIRPKKRKHDGKMMNPMHFCPSRYFDEIYCTKSYDITSLRRKERGGLRYQISSKEKRKKRPPDHEVASALQFKEAI
jgi:hypothetical protein